MQATAKGLATIACLALIAAGLVRGAPEPPAYRDDGEGDVLEWRLVAAESDVPVGRFVHRRSDRYAHSGRFSEQIGFTAGLGTQLLVRHDIGRARVLEELRISLWVNANRPNMRLMARVVLPESRNPDTAGAVVALLQGDSYTTPGQWQRLTIHQPQLLLERQQRMLNRRLGRGVSLRGAYVDEVILNAYAGTGSTELYLDDLEVVPFIGTKPPAPLPPALEASLPLAEVPVEVRHGQLLVNERPALLRAIAYQGESMEVLRAAGFNAVWFDEPADPQLYRRAHDAGLWVVAPPPAPETRAVLDESPWNSVLLWQLGGALGADQEKAIEARTQWLRRHDPRGRPITATITSGLTAYSRILDTVSVRRESIAGALDFRAVRAWLEQRVRLARAGTPLWAWIPTQAAPGVARMRDASGSLAGVADSVEPEQIRLFAYAALAAGIRGLGFWSTESLEASDPANRERLLALSLLNTELRLLDGLLRGASRVETLSGTPDDVEATLFRTPYGAVMLASWYGSGSQFVPGQAAENAVSFVVPGLPESTAVWDVSLAGVEPLPRGRVAGGVPVSLKEFGLTSIVLFSNDDRYLTALRQAIASSRKESARFALKLAQWKRNRVEQVDRDLAREGHALPDGLALLDRSRGFLEASIRDFNAANYRSAYQNAERSLRPLRILQRAHWDAAARAVSTPLTSPFATAFSTLPEHWQFIERLRSGTFGPNLVPEASFEDADALSARGWAYAQQETEAVRVTMELSPKSPRNGAYCLRLAVEPLDPQRAPAVLETPPIRVTSPPLPVDSGGIVRLSGWVRVPRRIAGSVVGAVLVDSLGGEPLQLQWQQTGGWQEFVAYRPVTQSGEVRFSLALAGFGEVAFDDLSVQVLDNRVQAQQAARKIGE